MLRPSAAGVRGAVAILAAPFVLFLACAGRPGAPAAAPERVAGLPPAGAALAAQTQPAEGAQVTAGTEDQSAEQIRADPRAYLESVYRKTQELEHYTLVFTRQERRGFFKRLSEPEHIQVWFRRAPFSVRMRWLDEHLKFGESLYVQGQYDDKVRFVTRWWTPPLLPPPKINEVELKTPVTFGESRRPMTDFGLERLLEETVSAIRDAGDEVTVTYQGLTTLANGTRAHHIRLEYAGNRYKAPVQDLYLDAATDLPAGTIIRFRNGDTDELYFYDDVLTDVRLTEADFRLEVEGGRTWAASRARPATQPARQVAHLEPVAPTNRPAAQPAPATQPARPAPPAAEGQ